MGTVNSGTSLTLRMMRTAATPEVAMILALLGRRFSSTGMVASAAWSNPLPSSKDRWLQIDRSVWKGHTAQ